MRKRKSTANKHSSLKRDAKVVVKTRRRNEIRSKNGNKRKGNQVMKKLVKKKKDEKAS